MVAPVYLVSPIISTTLPDMPAISPDFIFEMAIFTTSVVIEMGGLLAEVSLTGARTQR